MNNMSYVLSENTSVDFEAEARRLRSVAPSTNLELHTLAKLRHAHKSLRLFLSAFIFVSVLCASMTLYHRKRMQDNPGLLLFISSILTTSVVLSEFVNWHMYRIKLRRRVLSDPKMKHVYDLPVWSTPLSLDWLQHSLVLLLHCPVGVSSFGSQWVLIDALVFCRVFYLIPLLKDTSRLNTFKGRVLARLAHVPFSTSLTIRAQLHFYPVRVLISLFTLALVTLTFLVSNVEQNWSYYESFWCLLVTSMTIGYGDFIPTSVMGKLWCGLMTLIGLCWTSLLIAVLGQRIRLTDKQRRVVQITEHEKLAHCVRVAAAQTLQSAIVARNQRRREQQRGEEGTAHSSATKTPSSIPGWTQWRLLRKQDKLLRISHDLRQMRETLAWKHEGLHLALESQTLQHTIREENGSRRRLSSATNLMSTVNYGSCRPFTGQLPRLASSASSSSSRLLRPTSFSTPSLERSSYSPYQKRWDAVERRIIKLENTLGEIHRLLLLKKAQQQQEMN